MKFLNYRLKLQRRFAPLVSCKWDDFTPELKRFLNFIETTDVIWGIVTQMLAEYPDLPDALTAARAQNTSLQGETHSESAAIGYLIMKLAAAHEDRHGMGFSHFVEMRSEFATQLQDFRNLYVRPFYDELDERLQDSDQVLVELIHAKHTVEWFRRSEFGDLYAGDTRRGEKNLAWRFYSLLHDSGVEFSIEPTSISGSADMVLSQGSEKPLVADIKIFDPDSGKGSSYIKQGFRQVYQYLEDYNQAVGYLVVFAITEKQLRLTDLDSVGPAPSIVVHGKTIFIVQIDIFAHEVSASHRRPTTEPIGSAELIASLAAAAASGPPTSF